MAESSKPIILKLGGSVISHSNKIVDYDYLREFRDMLQEQILMGKRFVVAVGGGQTCRDFQNHARENGGVSDRPDLHWIGAAVNTLNAYMVRAFFGDELAEKNVWKFYDVDRLTELPFEKPIVVAGGFQAGFSSDGVALRIAQAVNALKIFDLKSVDGVYTDDPKKDPKAKFIPELSWEKYLDLIGNPEAHDPGGNLPIDPVAAKEAKELGAKYYVIKATDFSNIEAAINDEDFHGTVISN